MIKKQIILIGAFSETIELCELCDINIIGIIDNNIIGKHFGYDILGDDSVANKLFIEYGKIPLILSPDLPSTREKLYNHYSSLGFTFSNLISPLSTISRTARLGKGIIIQSHSNISSNVRLHNFVKINTYTNIMHDSTIKDFTTIAPNAVILGRVTINKRCYIGSNATILPKIEIGKDSRVGAGAVVTKNVKQNTTVLGVPAYEHNKKFSNQ